MDTSSFQANGLAALGKEPDATYTRLSGMVRDFDRYLRNDSLIEKMSLEEAAYVLDQIALFNVESDHCRVLSETQPRYMRIVAAGCRLSSDLVSKITSRMMDMLEASDVGINRVQKEMGEHIRTRHLSTSLLHKAHGVRNDTQRAAEASGLGVIL